MSEKTFHLVEPSQAELDKLSFEEQKNDLQFQKEKTALKFYMLGKGYIIGLKALGFLERYSSNKKRKDGVTPEMHHMIRIAFSVTQLKGLIDEEMCIVLALLHDLQEDEDVTREDIVKFFNEIIAEKNWKLTKKFVGVVKNKTEFMEALANDREAAIVKGLDRCDNLEHMAGVFPWKKINSYCAEAETLYVKMLRQASKNFPEYQTAFHTILVRMKRAIKSGRLFAEALSHLDDRQNQTRDMNQKLQEIISDHDLSVKKLKKAYDLTNSNTYEEHKNRIEALVSTVVGKVNSAGMQLPDALNKLHKENQRKLFDNLSKIILSNKSKTVQIEDLMTLLGFSSLDCNITINDNMSASQFFYAR